MTCTDLALVPANILPIQTTLQFAAPSLAESAAYLARCAQAEHFEVSRAAIERVLEDSIVHENPASSTPIPITRHHPHFDLRKALCQLQLLSRGPTPVAKAKSSPSAPADLKDATRTAESQSFVDAYLRRPPTLQVLDEIEAAIDVGQPGDVELSYHGIDAASQEVDLERRIALPPVEAPSEVDVAFASSRRDWLERAEKATVFLPASAPLLPAPSATLDYVPFICAIVHSEDQQEELAKEAGIDAMPIKAGTRRSRRLHGESYERSHLNLDDPTLAAARSLQLA